MKRILVMGFSMVVAAALLNSCNKELDHYQDLIPVENPFEKAEAAGYYGYAQISVPAATEKVYIEYKKQDGSIETIEQAVTPVVTIPTDGKDVEPFGTVKLMFKSDTPAKVQRVYYHVHDVTKADGDEEEVYTLQEVLVTNPSFGEFGKTRYVQMPWEFAWTNSVETGGENTKTYPKDVVFYDESHNHTLRYTYAYAGSVAGEAYFLTDFYEIEDHVVTAIKHQYCEDCTGCPYCMPWGCSCGCGGYDNSGASILKDNPNFVASGDITSQAGSNAVVVDPGVSGTVPTGDGGTVTVDHYGTIIVDYAPADLQTVQLPEPAYYTTTDGGFTMYHSSGVVMFDDRWPSLPDIDYLYDYNDVVIDYDIEALTVSDELLASEGWREKVKVTLHLRALGGDDAIGAGVVLENFNTDFVDYIEEYKTLDSGNHGELPTWTQTTLQENSLHYDNTPQAAPYMNDNNLRPAIEIGRLQALNSVDGKSTGGLTSGNEVYQYIDNKGNSYDHVFNPARKQWDAWKTPDENQYDESLDALYQGANPQKRTITDIQGYKLYNTVPGYMNVAGGLYTYTVEYYMKPRIDMTPEQSAACLANMVEAVVNTNNQNFYLVKKDHGAVGLKGYAPLDVPVKDFSRGYRAKYDEIVAANAGNMDPSTYYLASNGMVWGFKCPTLTRHAWELMPFALAYPNYRAWVESKGASHADWYKDADVNAVAISCEW